MLMDADPSLRELAAEIARPDAEINLARAALVIARSEYPRLDVDAYLDRLDALARGVGASARAADALPRLHRLREYLFGEQGFAGNCEDYFDPRNSFLNDVLDRRLGIPITLSLVLIEVGRRLDLPMEGVGLPGHFVTGMRLGDCQILLDPFNGGAIVTAEACRALVYRVLGHPVTLTETHFAPVSNRQFLTRMLNNLKASYFRREAWEKAVRVIDRLLLLDPDAGAERRDRGLALHSMGEFRRGIADWERYLTDFPNAPDHEKVLGHLRRVRQRLAQLN
jgi:regulator of sirC expression with transglutaminase-like and TPR domain